MNRLAGSTSPYLLQHADNPVHWEPWGEAALARARRESKPVFLSVGYSACHWCHVMAHECFENEAIARLLNESFVNVKVDREERPGTDDKVLVAWNGLAIDALAGAGAVLGEPRYVAAAIRAADFLLAECCDSAGRLANQWRRGQAGGLAFADDLACLVEGLVSLYEATFDERWITSAMELADRLVGESDHGSRADGGFLDPESGGFSRPQRSTSG